MLHLEEVTVSFRIVCGKIRRKWFMVSAMIQHHKFFYVGMV
jgi:hypothetical protein